MYAWKGFRPDEASNRTRQTDEVVAARSVAEVLRITGMTRSDWNYSSGCETGNEHQIRIATSEPGVVFWTELDSSGRADAVWHRVEPRELNDEAN